MFHKNKKIYIQFVKYLVIGTFGSLADLALLWFLTDILHIYYLASASLSFVILFFVGYTLHKYITFQNYQKNH